MFSENCSSSHQSYLRNTSFNIITLNTKLSESKVILVISYPVFTDFTYVSVFEPT